MSEINEDKNPSFLGTAVGSQNVNTALVQQFAELLKAYEDICNASRAALNVMENAILSKEALQTSEEKYRTKLEQEVCDRTAELNESKELLQATIDSSLDVIQVFKAVRNKEDKIVDFIWIMNNRKGIEQNGDVTGESLLAKNPGVIETGIFEIMVQVIETGVPNEREQFYNHEQFNGWFYQALVKFGDGVVMTTRDITEQKKVEEKIKELNKQLSAKNRELETANSELRTFSTIAANDYKETLQHLYTLFEFTVTNDARNLSNAGKANIRRAQSAIQKMKLLTDDIVEYSKVQEKASEIRAVNLNEIFNLTTQELKTKIEDTGAVVKVSENIKEIDGNHDLLSLLFYHLLDNAIKFRQTDVTPLIEIQSEIVPGKEIDHPDANPEIEYVVISVIDNGIGIEPSEKEKIFEMFYKGHDKNFKGSGIGLAICKKIMNMHNGFIAAEVSPQGTGTVIKCFFPLEGARA